MGHTNSRILLLLLLYTWQLGSSPNQSIQTVTSYEAWHGKKPDLSYLHTLGCTAYHHMKGARRKLDDKSLKCQFLGYEEAGWLLSRGSWLIAGVPKGNNNGSSPTGLEPVPIGNIVCYSAGTAELGLRYEPSKMEGVGGADFNPVNHPWTQANS